jgi:hypothetical protein
LGPRGSVAFLAALLGKQAKFRPNLFEVELVLAAWVNQGDRDQPVVGVATDRPARNT